MTYTVYGLKDPQQATYRYVGITSGATSTRLARHRRDASAGSTLLVHQWMRDVGPRNIIMDVLEDTPEDAAYLSYAEKYWVAELKSYGHDLLNMTMGGYGASGLIWTPENRAKISGEGNPFYGRKHTESAKEKMKTAPRASGSEHHLHGIKQSEEHIQKRFEDWDRWTPEAREVQAQRWRDSNPMKGVRLTGDKNGFYGKKHSPETRAKMSLARKKGHHLRKHSETPDPKCDFCI